MGRVRIKVIYCGGWGYKPKYEALKEDLESDFPGELEYASEATKNVTGDLEVYVNGKLIHSKKNGNGYIDSEEKYKKIVKAVESALQ